MYFEEHPYNVIETGWSCRNSNVRLGTEGVGSEFVVLVGIETGAGVDGYMGGLIDGWIDKWIDGRIDRWMDVWVDKWMCGWMDECVHGSIDGCMNGWLME